MARLSTLSVSKCEHLQNFLTVDVWIGLVYCTGIYEVYRLNSITVIQGGEPA